MPQERRQQGKHYVFCWQTGQLRLLLCCLLQDMSAGKHTGFVHMLVNAWLLL